MGKGVNKVIVLDAEIVGLYVDQKLGIIAISDATGVARSTVRNRLVRAGVKMRTRQEGLRANPNLGNKLLGRKRGPMSAEQKEKISKTKLGRPGAGVSEKTSGYVVYTRGPHKGRGVHTVKFEQRIGRSLLPDEVVHHVDGKRNNNDIDNLALMTRSAHTRLHRREQTLTREKKNG